MVADGDSESVQETLPAAGFTVAEQIDTPTAQGSYKVHEQGLREVVTDKGYHSGVGLAEMSERVRTYVSVPKQPRRNWEGKGEQQAAVYANRRRVEGERGKSLLRRRGELLERPTSLHQYETGGMRRLHVRGRGNVAKRVLLQAAAFNLALILRSITKAGTPKGLADLKKEDRFGCIASSRRSLGTTYAYLRVYEHLPVRFSLSDRVRSNSPQLRPARKSRF